MGPRRARRHARATFDAREGNVGATREAGSRDRDRQTRPSETRTKVLRHGPQALGLLCPARPRPESRQGAGQDEARSAPGPGQGRIAVLYGGGLLALALLALWVY